MELFRLFLNVGLLCCAMGSQKFWNFS